jgi:hypothetical protein
LLPNPINIVLSDEDEEFRESWTLTDLVDFQRSPCSFTYTARFNDENLANYNDELTSRSDTFRFSEQVLTASVTSSDVGTHTIAIDVFETSTGSSLFTSTDITVNVACLTCENTGFDNVKPDVSENSESEEPIEEYYYSYS